ncbi:hypothetical protein N0V88_000714 [Collariella sp. IMI 366227]|nr:hypothetical protein N0V88_000714 [Collariella sp. IMI 366227]
MAPPFTPEDTEEFERVKAKAVSQLIYRNDENSDTQTMALKIAWLNDCYRGQGESGRLHIERWPDLVIMFDGTSEKPIRLMDLRDAVKGQLAQLGVPDTVHMSQHKIVSHANETYSATSCLA